MGKTIRIPYECMSDKDEKGEESVDAVSKKPAAMTVTFSMCLAFVQASLKILLKVTLLLRRSCPRG